jgi:hypothetical protein
MGPSLVRPATNRPDQGDAHFSPGKQAAQAAARIEVCLELSWKRLRYLDRDSGKVYPGDSRTTGRGRKPRPDGGAAPKFAALSDSILTGKLPAKARPNVQVIGNRTNKNRTKLSRFFRSDWSAEIVKNHRPA